MIFSLPFLVCKSISLGRLIDYRRSSLICGEYSKYNLVYICIGWNNRAGFFTPKLVCSWYQSFAMETKSDTSKVSDEHVKNQISPYYLSASDNPGNIITQVQLKGDNYDEWARAIRTAL